MKRKSILGVLASALLLLAARKAVQRRNKGWFVAPVGASRRAQLLTALPRFCRQGLRRLGLTLPVFEAPAGHLVSIGKTGTGKTSTALDWYREPLERGEPILYRDIGGDERLARRFADALSRSGRILFPFAEETSRSDTASGTQPDRG